MLGTLPAGAWPSACWTTGRCRGGPVGGEQRAGLALEHAAELDVNLRNHVVRDGPHLRQPAVVHVAIRIGRVDRRRVDAGKSLNQVDVELG